MPPPKTSLFSAIAPPADGAPPLLGTDTPLEPKKPKRSRARSTKVALEDEPEEVQDASILHIADPMSACRTVLLIKNLTFFLAQEGYDFELPTE